VVDLFLPKTRGPHPVVVLIHGGCYLAEYRGLAETSGVAAEPGAARLRVWNVEYRKLARPGRAIRDVPRRGGRRRPHRERGPESTAGPDAWWPWATRPAGTWRCGPRARHRLPKTSPLWRADPLPIRAVDQPGGIGDLEGQGHVFAGACGPEPIPKIIGLATPAHAYADTSPAELLPSGARW
jgi:hypothetical protein